jgi:hypothetical protein
MKVLFISGQGMAISGREAKEKMEIGTSRPVTREQVFLLISEMEAMHVICIIQPHDCV